MKQFQPSATAQFVANGICWVSEHRCFGGEVARAMEAVRWSTGLGAMLLVVLGAGFDPVSVSLGVKVGDERSIEVGHPGRQGVEVAVLGELGAGLPVGMGGRFPGSRVLRRDGLAQSDGLRQAFCSVASRAESLASDEFVATAVAE